MIGTQICLPYPPSSTITINAKGTYNHQYVGLAHELGHIILYLQGSAFGHGQIGVDAAITLRENQLKDKLGYDY